ncbi:hypothetical protein [Burkholderia phage BCSR5]|nr:hypothetical protein [Burkholderia phage BCSR5]
MTKQELYDRLVVSFPSNVRARFWMRDNLPKVQVKLERRLGEYTLQTLFDYLQPERLGRCQVCSKPTRFRNFVEGYKPYCGNKCSNNDPKVQQAKVEAYRRKYGVDNPSQAASVKRKKVKTCLKNYGVPQPQLSREIRKKSERTLMKRFGVRNPTQNAEVFLRGQRTRFGRKKVKVCGRTFHVQGYEGHAIKFLVEGLGIDVKAVSTQCDSIEYWDSQQERHRVYHPDFAVGDLIIEVKSDYTAGLGNEEIFCNLRDKMKGVRRAGCKWLVLVMNRDGTLLTSYFNKVGKGCSDHKEIKRHVIRNL